MKLFDALTFRKKSTPAGKTQPLKEGGSVKLERVTNAPQGSKERPLKRQLIIRPIVTEKSSALARERSYVFLVHSGANKIEIKKAIQELYNVLPLSVNVLKTEGKIVRYGRTQGRTKGEKKAMVTLRAGDSINLPHAR